MPGWQNSNRRSRLPSDWSQIRSRILRRDQKQCQVIEDGRKCLDFANEVDHITAGDNHEDWNLQAICSWHHKAKSSGEGGLAAQAKRKQIRNRYRRTEQHPGLL